jgi:hypothetical protein
VLIHDHGGVKWPNGAGQWRAANDIRLETEAESARPLKQQGWASWFPPPEKQAAPHGRQNTAIHE